MGPCAVAIWVEINLVGHECFKKICRRWKSDLGTSYPGHGLLVALWQEFRVPGTRIRFPLTKECLRYQFQY